MPVSRKTSFTMLCAYERYTSEKDFSQHCIALIRPVEDIFYQELFLLLNGNTVSVSILPSTLGKCATKRKNAKKASSLWSA